MIRILQGQGLPIERFQEKFTVQLNDTHPSIAVVELMRLLLDEYHLDWESAWQITRQTFAYTNHTLLPEALEKWSISLFGKLFPRLLEIIYEINGHFLQEVRSKFPSEEARLARMSLIDESGDRYVRMANLACVGSFAINGVAQLHSELLKQTVLKDFYEFSPEKFSNKTNGVTPRRWIVLSNPRLTQLIEQKIGNSWIKHLENLRQLEGYAEDAGFRSDWRQVKLAVKQDLAQHIERELGTLVDIHSLFDVQVKRIHEYKRQHLRIYVKIT